MLPPFIFDLHSPLFLAFIFLWVIPWKCIALWKAGQNRQMVWFAVILTINTFAFLDIYYVFFHALKRQRITIEEPNPESEGSESDIQK